MSYFLEDTVSTSSAGVLIDYTGMNESMFNAEMAWANIMESAMKNEYMAIKNESSEMLQEGISEFFAKIKKWFMNMIHTIQRVVSNIKNKILLKFDVYAKFAAKAEKILRKKTSLNSDKEIKIFDYSGIDFDNVLKKLKELKDKNDFTKDNRKAEIEKIEKDYQEIRKKISDCKSTTTKAGSYTKWNDDIKVLKDSLHGCKNSIEKFNKAIKACKVGIVGCDKEDKNTVTENKSKVKVLNQAASRYLNIYMARCSFAKRNISNILKAYSKPKSSDNSSDSNNDSKTESYFGF